MKKFRSLCFFALLFLVSISSFAVSSISWKYSRDLPIPKGFDKQIGVAQTVFGKIGSYVIVAGGANFPNKSVLEGGGAAKIRYSDLFLFKESGSGLELVKQTNLPVELEGATSITTDKGIYAVGGAMNNGVSSDIIYITLNSSKTDVEIKKIGTLPFNYQMGVAKIKDDAIYIVSGNQNGAQSSKLFKFDIKTAVVTELAAMPAGTERYQSVGEILNNGKEDLLYVFGGGTGKVAFTDGYAYSFKTNTWVQKSNVKIDNSKEISVLGARAIKLNNTEMLVLGGFNKVVWDKVNAEMPTLQGAALDAYRAEYFNRDPQDFGWNEEILIYNSASDSWKSIGKVPFLANCGEGLVMIEDRLYSINGEIKPGVRTPKIFVGTMK